MQKTANHCNLPVGDKPLEMLLLCLRGTHRGGLSMKMIPEKVKSFDFSI